MKEPYTELTPEELEEVKAMAAQELRDRRGSSGGVITRLLQYYLSGSVGFPTLASAALRGGHVPEEPVVSKAPLACPHCAGPHVDVGKWAIRPHKTHLCAYCGQVWRENTFICGTSTDLEAVARAEGFDAGLRYANNRPSIHRTALRFYALPSNWRPDPDSPAGTPPRAEEDRGNCARVALGEGDERAGS